MKKMLTLLAASGVFLLAACSKSGAPDPVDGMNKIQSSKFTIKVNGSPEDLDHIVFAFSGGASNHPDVVWKVNGVERPNENTVGFGTEDFTSSTTYIIESAVPLLSISVGITVMAVEDPLTFSYKAEVNGKTLKDIKDQTVAEGSGFNVNYSYTE